VYVADLAQERGRQHRPDAELPEQAGVGLDNHGLDARLHRSYALLQLANVVYKLASQLPAGNRRCSGRHNLGEQRGGALGGEVASGAAGDQVHQQPVEPVDALSAGGDQALPSLG
jgi:hypothetical protein